MRMILWAVFLATLAVLWGREILAFAEARRERPTNHKREELRFRRRTLGLVLLFLMVMFHDLASVVPFAGPQHLLGWLGISLILFIWILIVAVRDFRDLSQTYLDGQTEVTLEALLEVEEQLRRKGKTGDSDPIPRIRFEESQGEERAQDRQ